MLVKNSKHVYACIQKNPECIHTQLEVSCKEYRHFSGSISGTVLDLKIQNQFHRS